MAQMIFWIKSETVPGRVRLALELLDRTKISTPAPVLHLQGVHTVPGPPGRAEGKCSSYLKTKTMVC